MSTPGNRSTPGVYVTESDAFPPAIAGVQTAVPAFIGYTEYARDAQGKPLYDTPVSIASLADYQRSFGGAFSPLYTFEQVTPPAAYDFMVSDPDTPQTIYVKLVPASPSRFNLYDSLRLFYANGGGTCYVVSVANYGGTRADPQTPASAAAGATIDKTLLETGLAAIREQTGPTMLVMPDAVNLPPASGSDAATSQDFAEVVRAMMQQCGDLGDRVALLDVWGTDRIDPAKDIQTQLDACIAAFQDAVGDDAGALPYGIAYFPFLDTAIVARGEIDYTSIDPTGDGYPQIRHYLTLAAARLYGSGTPAYQKVQGLIASLYPPSEQNPPPGVTVPRTPAEIAALNQGLCAAIPLLQQIEDVIVQRANVLPPSGAMAGLFAYNDSSRGVWTAPANLAPTAVVSPTLKLTDAQQGALNAPVNGKAVNVIRYFVGCGPLVWGARTLDGNSPDWRYVQVRRTVIYVEQSIKAALAQFVFAPNDGKTWVTVVSMVSNFLQWLWAQGGLMGDKASDAFTVQCGLGSTMTGQDILDGYMIVSVTLQMIRPAEFIELTFKQQMQGAA